MVVELLVAALVLALLAVLARRAWVIAHRAEEEPITETQARANAAPLTTAILPTDHRDREPI
jgi:hypothetical protein